MKKIIYVLCALLAMSAGVYGFKASQSDFTTLAGEGYQWQDLNEKWVVVNVFAEWCAPCLREVPELNVFASQLREKSDTVFFAINYDSAEVSELTRLKDTYDMQFNLIASAIDVLPVEQPKGLPVTFVFPPNGEKVVALYGEQTAEGLSKQLKKLQRL